MFEPDKLLFIILFTCIVFSWLFYYREKTARIFFVFFGFLYLIYSGIGGAADGVPTSYLTYYCIFTLCINIGVYLGLSRIKNTKKTFSKSWYEYFKYFIKRYADKVIILYFVLKLASLVYPEFKLMNLLSPPAPDAIAMLRARFSGEGTDALNSIISTLNSFVYPFYLLSLYKYCKKTVKFALLIILPFYIDYCTNAYIGRSGMMEAALIIFAVTYFCRPKVGKKLLVAGLVAIPFVLVFLVQYSLKRIGGVSEEISTMDAIEILLSQEGGLQGYFSDILKMHDTYISRYILWLLTMPFPGFVRGGVDVHFAAIYSEQLLGIDRSANGFYILLPGVVGESVFLFGKYLFWINGIIYGFLMGFFYRILTRYPQLIVILIVSEIQFGYVMNRVGLFGGIPFFLKILVYFYLILWWMKNYTWKSKGLKRHYHFIN